MAANPTGARTARHTGDAVAASGRTRAEELVDHFGDESLAQRLATDEAAIEHRPGKDTDGDIDVLSASRADGKVAWYENRGGQFGITQTQGGSGAGNQRVLNNAVLTSRGRSGDPAL